MNKPFIILCTITCIATCFTIGWTQNMGNDSDFRAFLDQLMDDIFMPIMSRGIRVNNQQRAMLLGYALKKQAGDLGESEADKTRMNRLKENVRAMLSEISTDNRLWSIADEAFRGRHDNEVLRLCDGSFKWSPIFTSPADSTLEEEGGVVAGEDREIKPSRLLKKVDPVYPELARLSRIQGVVVLKVRVNEEGIVEKAEIVKSDHSLFNDPALEAVKQWKYEVLFINGKPTPAVFEVSVAFELN